MAYYDTSGLQARRVQTQHNINPGADIQQAYSRINHNHTGTIPQQSHTNEQHDQYIPGSRQLPEPHTKQDPMFVLSGDILPMSFRTESHQIAKDVVQYVCRHENPIPSPTQASSTMRDLVDDTLKSRLDMMCQLVTTLDIKGRQQLELINSIATNMFDDQVVNWSRIVTFVSFCGYLARFCEQKHIPDCADDIGTILGDILVNRLGLWIVSNGGWNSFQAQFPNACVWQSSGLWKGIGIVALLLGCVIAFCSSMRFVGN